MWKAVDDTESKLDEPCAPRITIWAIVTRPRIIQLAVLLSLAPFAVAHAEHFPTKIYTTADSLAANLVNHIVVDSHGYVWICTREGLSQLRNPDETEGRHRDVHPIL